MTSTKQKFTTQLNDLNMVELPKVLVEQLNVGFRTKVALTTKDNKILITEAKIQYPYTRAVDEFNRVVVPKALMQLMNWPANAKLDIQSYNEKSISIKLHNPLVVL